MPVWFDTDMDFDDAAALAYLIQEHKLGHIVLKGITVTNNGAGLPGTAIQHARCILKATGLQGIPVADGSPLAPHLAPPELRAAVELVLSSVLAGCTESSAPGALDAAALLTNAVESAPEPIVLVTSGPLTNVARAFGMGLRADKIHAAFVMGGAVRVPGNLCCSTTLPYDGSQELNIWIDPPSASAVLSSLRQQTTRLVPLDATQYVPITTAFVERLQADQNTAEAKLVAAIATHPVVASGTTLGQAYWWDPLTAVAATHARVVTFDRDSLAVVVEEGAQSGRTVLSPEGSLMRVGVFADQSRFEEIFLDALNGRPHG